ncbi:hypothetical protein HKBW3S03_01254 [Candidatus Hakubella thermalkaliphila]|uniref:Uncharacterized protein n=1 Tax=Candidatus Hakubella thermalkaliphila TaxID=2754717 RepID=A0A6V8NKD3_9ACTN|nr:UPF0175 family protein [Candidatus Hakubella thermalkaliphila]MBT9171383.1 hypothetical protein [Actinomycetota bacterium]GFP19750.1 hypothetical protein HKBW3S03_01254 [Candidatus Hakubella thermalkaliphila]GFP30082.1 hypothetical protein HKBW3S34_01002 [Candidatus Hakubella thermalkaliphila]GFP36458.1 hypothetical protein HKBW3S44_00141 [Candidatus Hakubella thermalkaliphila]GFP39546.1 hypothetical protein HKBW3S47_01244 [Candidatus Hakubella thermalkaliphila]
MKELRIRVPDELVDLIGSEEMAQKEAKEALILDLVGRGKISKGKAAQLLGVSLWDLPEVLAKYRIPWFDYTAEELKKDLEFLKKVEREEEAAG